MQGNHTQLPDRDGTHVTSTVRLSGKPKVKFFETGDGYIAADIECLHGYVGLCATEEWFDAFEAGRRAFTEARKAAAS